MLLLLLTFAVVVSSTGLTLGMHLCAGEISHFALFGQSRPCPMDEPQEKLPPCHREDGEALPLEDAATACCENQTLTVDQVDLLKPFGKSLAPAAPELTFVAVVAAVWSYLFGIQQPVIPHVPDYSPPALARNIPVLVQSFLI
jgi:hypothetical protein